MFKTEMKYYVTLRHAAYGPEMEVQVATRFNELGENNSRCERVKVKISSSIVEVDARFVLPGTLTFVDTFFHSAALPR